jgi:hypothetical protein
MVEQKIDAIEPFAVNYMVKRRNWLVVERLSAGILGFR